MAINFFRAGPLFQGLSDQELKIMAADFLPREFRVGQTIFHQRDSGRLLYLVESGQV
ncbi:MAG: hypothetical protein WAM60_04920 [Candidatus Promineifilaceae bacterium]